MWTNLEAIMLSEGRQAQKDKYCVILITWYIKNRVNQETESKGEAIRGWEEVAFSLPGVENVSK